MLQHKKVQVWNISGLWNVVKILDRCGKHMAAQYGLHHWDNCFLKNMIIVVLCALKNKIWLVYEGDQVMATFQTKKTDKGLYLQKLGTDPQFSGRGVGSFCIKTVEQMARAEGCTKVYFEVYTLSEHALRFYENKGYTNVGRASTLKYSEIKMEKNLE